jgi:hypothetical protein
MNYPSGLILVVCSLMLAGSVASYQIQKYNILTTTLDYDKAIELCKNNDSVDYIKFNNYSSIQFIKCKNGAEFKVNGK